VLLLSISDAKVSASHLAMIHVHNTYDRWCCILLGAILSISTNCQRRRETECSAEQKDRLEFDAAMLNVGWAGLANNTANRPGQVNDFFKRWAIMTVAALVAAQLVSGIHATPLGLIVASLLLGILNAVVRPILIFFSAPLILVTFGLFFFVINALLLYWVGHLKGFRVDSFWDAFWGSLIISVVSMVLNWVTKRPPPPSKPPPPPPRDTGSGPVIDV
jgi:putative membrane protein